MFQKKVDDAFAACDSDEDGTINKLELYTGVIFIHLKMAENIGPPGCNPPSKDVCDAMFEASDADEDGKIDRSEFDAIVEVLCATIVWRVTIYYFLLVLTMPFLATRLIIWSNIPRNTYWEFIVREGISLVFILLIIPHIWAKVDAKYSQWGKESNADVTNLLHLKQEKLETQEQQPLYGSTGVSA